MYLVLDTETTGVKPTDRIVSMAWAGFDETGTEVVLTHHLVIPDGFTIPRDATAIHGITTEEARRKGVPIGTVLTLHRPQRVHPPEIKAESFEAANLLHHEEHGGVLSDSTVRRRLQVAHIAGTPPQALR